MESKEIKKIKRKMVMELSDLNNAINKECSGIKKLTSKSFIGTNKCWIFNIENNI